MPNDHVRELIGQLEALGIKASPPGDDDGEEEEWIDEDSEDEDVEMS
ncbi:hypothetical protein MPER_13888 [Moniliophthora perniciosa FA553]|nr:hypothetical protein MPER_13888 [Moniliophthora perniciosa FA553]